MDSIESLATEFHREGYLILEDCIPLDALDAARELMLSSSQDIEARLDEAGVKPGNVDHFLAVRPAAMDQAAYDELRALVSGNFPKTVKGHDAFWDLLGSERLRAVLKRILDAGHLYLHMFPSPRRVVPTSSLAAVPRHVDRQYNGHMSNFVTVWVPIEAFAENAGGVRVFPKSHEFANTPAEGEARRLDNDLWFAPVHGDLSDGVFARVPKGGALLLHRDVVHESVLNRSGSVRLSADLRVFGDRDTTTKHYLDLQERKVFEPSTGERHV